MSKIAEQTGNPSVTEKERANDPSGIRTHAPSPLNPSKSGGFSPPLNAPTVPSTVPLPPPAPHPTASEVRSDAGAAPPPYDFGQMRSSELLHGASALAGDVAALALKAGDSIRHAQMTEFSGELRARAWSLENEATEHGKNPGWLGSGVTAVLRAIGEIRS